MPSSHMPSSFASAASGQSSSRQQQQQPRNGRNDGGSADWGRRPASNGIHVMRRPSNVHSAQQSTASEDERALPSEEGNNEQNTRYGRDELLSIFAGLSAGSQNLKNVDDLFENGWNPGQSNNGTNGRASWGKNNDAISHGPDVCWDSNGQVQPIGLTEISAEERQLFADVNSPLKPPPQNQNKDANAQGGANGRKTSVSHSQSSFGLNSPSSSRPGTRRRETSDSVTGNLASPAGNGRFPRDEPSPFLTRKFGDKDGGEEHEGKTAPPFGTLLRSNTAGGALGNGPSSPWGAGPTGVTMSPMGNFGSFGLPGTSSIPPTPSDKRPPFSARAESRLVALMSEKNMEDSPSKNTDRPWRSRPRTDTDPFGDDPAPTGSAALGGGQDESPPANRTMQGLDTPVKGTSGDFGMSNMPGFRDSQRGGLTQQTPMGQPKENEPMSPSDTNPYRSPPENQDRNRNDDSYDGDVPHHRLGGIPEYGHNAFSNLPKTFSGVPFEGSDRSQNSSVSGHKFPPLGGMQSLGGWPTSTNSIGTPDSQARSGFTGAFGNSVFGPMGELQSPSLGGFGSGIFGPGTSGNISGTNTAGRGSKLSSLFPAQMQVGDNENAEGGDMRQSGGFGAIGRHAFPPSRDTDSPMRPNRHAFEDMFPDNSRNQGPFSSSDNPPSQTSTAFGNQMQMGGPNYQQSQNSDTAVPVVQQRMMVMPDRMRWVYLDPQGQVQGPWSGLEMHDWYKASFFSADLSVKKLEDSEFEPLGQLIRRIGNSREPFLVPQIGIAHGPPTSQSTSSFAPAAATPGGSGQPGVVQPPFAGAFPSFGTTLTAEQQNNLERRKQEEQYLMARQREFLAQQQVNMKQMQMSGLPGSALHHQSSVHSLQSQPSFGSMTSPIGMPPQPNLTSFFDGAGRQPQAQVPGGITSEFFREDDLARLNLQDRQPVFGAVPQQPQAAHAQQVPVFSQPQLSETQREANRTDQLRQNDPQGFKARLKEFEELRAQHDQEEAVEAARNVVTEPIGPPAQQNQQFFEEPQEEKVEDGPAPAEPDVLSLTQQVQKAASAKQSPIPSTQSDSPWAKVSNTSLPMPFPPPPQSTTPLPAPTAQRSRSNLPDALAAGSRSRSETPEIAAPSLAPWAKEQPEAQKGPSLKEIQEAEAKKAAKAEEAAAAIRRQNHEHEMRLFAAQAPAPAPALPTTATWATGSPATPSQTIASPWGNPAAAAKVQAASNVPASKKTLTVAEVMREEERKLKAQKAQQAAAAPPVRPAGGKGYSDIASKPVATPTVGPAWSTVGAGGKVKVPTGPAAASPIVRTSSSSSATPITTAASRVVRPVAVTRSTATTGQSSTAAAHAELAKWTRGVLAGGLNKGTDVDQFIDSILQLPPIPEIIADAIYQVSQTLDGNYLSEEFIRRRKQADKGVFEPSTSGSGSTSAAGGWSEVAKKGPQKEEPAAGFKVVPNKKKGKK